MQYDWEILLETNDLERFNMSIENLFYLNDLWLKKSGNDKILTSRGRDLAKYMKALANHILKMDAESEMDYKIMLKKMSSKISSNDKASDLHAKICKAATINIDKRTTSVEDYLGYYEMYRNNG